MFRDTLARSRRSGDALRFAPPPPVLAEVAELVIERHGDGDGPPKSPEELKALLERLRLAGFDWDNIRAADRFDVAWVLWHGAEPPAEHAAFLSAFLRWVETPWRRFQALRLAASWAEAFDPRLKSMRVVADWLAAHAMQLLEPWPALVEEFDIFSLARAPLNLAKYMLAADETEPVCVARLGLTGRTEAAGLRLEALGAATDYVRARLVRKPALAARLMEISRHQPAFQTGLSATPRRVRVQAIRAKLAEAMLLPWQHEDPAAGVKEQIIDYLLRYYHDPRLGDALWAEICPPAVSIMRAWLKEKTIAAFFRLTADRKSDGGAQARVRHAFWTPYIDRIDEVWLVAGAQCIAALDAPKLGYGRLVGCRPDNCALILKIGGLTIVESSHAENERVWLAGNELAPPLYEPLSRAYCPAMLTTGADFSSGYGSQDGGRWQERLHGFIERHTGISRPDGVARTSRPGLAARRPRGGYQQD